MANIETSLKWMYDKMAAKVTYSMVHRNGPNSYDCSSAVYFSLITGGFLPGGQRIGNTDSLFGDLERAGWVKTNTPTRGSIFIWGVRGASSGAAGHTGFFINNTDIIHCSYGYNGTHVDSHAWLRSINGNPAVTYYTHQGAPYAGDTDQSVDVGSTIRFDKVFTVNDVQLIGGIWQVKSDELCREGFSWDDNGIPAEPLYEVDTEGYATPDQNLNPGSLFKLPGKYTVLDWGENNGRWLAMIEWSGLKFWVDLEHATEIKAADNGTPIPGKRPEVPQTPQPPVEPPKPVTPTPEPTPEPPVIETPLPAEPVKPTPIEPPKEKPTMAFSADQQQQLSIATQTVIDANEFTPVISDHVKTVAYFATDIIAVLSGFTLAVLAILSIVDGTVAIMLNSALVAAMLGLKDTFRISAKKK